MISLLLSLLRAVISLLTCGLVARSQPPKERVTVCIVGAGFGGLYLARELAEDSEGRFDVVLIEPKRFCEYTPGTMKAVVTPEHLRSLTASIEEAVPIKSGRVKVIQGVCEGLIDGSASTSTSTSARPHAVVRLVGSGSGSGDGSGQLQHIPFDTCVIATGSSYRRPYKADHLTALDADFRYRELLSTHDALKEAEHAVVVGLGPVGTELAAEILHKWPSKRLTAVNFAPSVLFGMDPAVGQAAHRWLEDRGCKVMLGTNIVHEESIIEAGSSDAGASSAGAPSSATSAASRRSSSSSSLDSLLAPGATARPPDGADGSALRLRNKQQQPQQENGSKQQALPHALPKRRVLLVTAKGERIEADVVLHCSGVVPNTAFLNAPASSAALAASLVPPPPPPALPSAPRVCTDRFLRVIPWSGNTSSSAGAGTTINALFFAVGDAAKPPYGEPALAHTAEKHAECVLRSLRRLAGSIHASDSSDALPMWRRVAAAAASSPSASSSNPLLCSYPESLTGIATAPVIMDVSLGPYEALLAFDCLSLTDPVGRRLAAAMKLLLETTKVSQMRNGWFGKAFWHASDEIALLIHGKVTGPLTRWMKEREEAKKRKGN